MPQALLRHRTRHDAAACTARRRQLHCPSRKSTEAVSNAEAPLFTNDPNATSAQGNAQCSVRVVSWSTTPSHRPKGPPATDATSVADAVLLVPNPAPGTDCARPGRYCRTSMALRSRGRAGAGFCGLYGRLLRFTRICGGAADLPRLQPLVAALPPCLQAEPSAAVVIDAIRAARNWLQQAGLASALEFQTVSLRHVRRGFVTLLHNAPWSAISCRIRHHGIIADFRSVSAPNHV